MCTQVAQSIVTITFFLLIQFLTHGQGFEHQVNIIVKGRTDRSYFFLGRTGRTLDQRNYLEVIERQGSCYIEKDSEKESKKTGSVLGKIVARMANRLKAGRETKTRCWVNMGRALPNVNGLNCEEGWFMLYGALFSAITLVGEEYRTKVYYSGFWPDENEIEKNKSEVAALTSSSSRHGDTKKQKVNTNSKTWIRVSEEVEGSKLPQPEQGQILNLQVMFRPERDNDRLKTIEVLGELLLVSDQEIGTPQHLEPSWTNNLILRINPGHKFKFKDGEISRQGVGNYHIFIRVVENTAKPELPTTDQPAQAQPFDVANTEWQRMVIFAMFCDDDKAIGFNVAICSNTIEFQMQVVPDKPNVLQKDATWIRAKGTLNEMERTMVLGQPVDCKGEKWVPIGTLFEYLCKPDVWSRRYGTEVAVKSTFVYCYAYNGKSTDLYWSAKMKLDLSGVLDTPEIKLNYSFI